MNPVVGVDPGLRECGVGVVDVESNRVLRGWLVRNPITSRSPEPNDGPEAWRSMARIVAQEVSELLREVGWMLTPPLVAVERQYIGGTTPQVFSIMRIVGVVGALSLALPGHRIVEVMPTQWRPSKKKGAKKGKPISKDESNQQVWGSMSPAEQALAEDAQKKSTGHNVKDGLGIAMWAAVNFQHLMTTGQAKGTIKLQSWRPHGLEEE